MSLVRGQRWREQFRLLPLGKLLIPGDPLGQDPDTVVHLADFDGHIELLDDQQENNYQVNKIDGSFKSQKLTAPESNLRENAEDDHGGGRSQQEQGILYLHLGFPKPGQYKHDREQAAQNQQTTNTGEEYDDDRPLPR